MIARIARRRARCEELCDATSSRYLTLCRLMGGGLAFVNFEFTVMLSLEESRRPEEVI